MRGEMAVGAVRLDQCHGRGHVEQLGLRNRGARFGAGQRPGRRAGSRLDRGSRQAEAFEDVLEEALLALQKAVEGAEKLSRLRALDDAVIVGR